MTPPDGAALDATAGAPAAYALRVADGDITDAVGIDVAPDAGLPPGAAVSPAEVSGADGGQANVVTRRFSMTPDLSQARRPAARPSLRDQGSGRGAMWMALYSLSLSHTHTHTNIVSVSLSLSIRVYLHLFL